MKYDFLAPGNSFFSYKLPLFRGRRSKYGHMFLVVYATDEDVGFVDVTTAKLDDKAYYFKQKRLPHNIELELFDPACRPFGREVFVETSTFRVMKKRDLLKMRIWSANGYNGPMDTDVLNFIRADIERCCETSYRGLSRADFLRMTV